MKLRVWPLLSVSLAARRLQRRVRKRARRAAGLVLRLPPRAAPASQTPARGSVLVQRPEAGPGLDSDRIALLRSEQRFDFYAASRWAAPAPDVIESVMIDALRATGAFSAVFDDAAPFAPRYNLRCTLRRFEADYTEGGGGAPTVYVALDCTLGRHRDRALLASFTAQGSAAAGEDRLERGGGGIRSGHGERHDRTRRAPRRGARRRRKARAAQKVDRPVASMRR